MRSKKAPGPTSDLPPETLAAFLARGGKITKCPPATEEIMATKPDIPKQILAIEDLTPTIDDVETIPLNRDNESETQE